MIRTLLRIVLHADRWHLRWAMREVDRRHSDTGYIVERLATIEQRLATLRRCHCA